RAGFVLGPAVFLICWLWPTTLSSEAQTLGAILSLMVVFWVTEVLPLAVTALLGPLLVVLLGVAPMRTAFSAFADPIVFLFIGSFMLAEAMLRHGLARRIAYRAIASPWVGASALRLTAAYVAVGCVLSMWMSN